MTKHIDVKLFLSLTLGFIAFTIIGTLSHELGHWSVAELLGYDAYIKYNYCYWDEIPGAVYPNHFTDHLWISFGGPAQTMLTGSIGLFLLHRNQQNKTTASFWIFIFLTLFWSREVFNYVMSLIPYFIDGEVSYRGDEQALAYHLGFPVFTFSLVAALIGIMIMSLVFFKYIPLDKRLTFLVSGAMGSALGYYLWLVKFGPMLI